MTTDARREAVAASSDIIGAKWTALLIYDLAEGTCRFRELDSRVPASAAARWPSLQHCSVPASCAGTAIESPPRQYEQTDKGRDLVPILEAMTYPGRSWLYPLTLASASADLLDPLNRAQSKADSRQLALV